MTVPATIRPVPLLSVTTLSLAAYVIIPHQDGSPMAVAAIALTVLTIGLMATNALPEFIYASLFFAIALIFQIAPTEAVFSGFRSGAPAGRKDRRGGQDRAEHVYGRADLGSACGQALGCRIGLAEAVCAAGRGHCDG